MVVENAFSSDASSYNANDPKNWLIFFKQIISGIEETRVEAVSCLELIESWPDSEVSQEEKDQILCEIEAP